MRPCTCDTCATDLRAQYTLDQCRLCWLYHHDGKYKELWDRSPGVPDATACRHRGAATGDTIQCPACSGTVALKLFACAIHGSCTQSRPVESVACCANCRDRSPAQTMNEEAGNPPSARPSNDNLIQSVGIPSLTH